MAIAPKFLDILERLVRREVEFILVGGVAAILEGAPVSTLDLDIVFDPAEENRRRLLEALQDLNARYLDPAGRHLVPDEAKLSSFRLHQLLTDFGPLDVLRTIGSGMGFADLIGHTQEYTVGDLRVRTLRLEMIILSKEQASRDKDRATLPVLRRTLDLKAKAAD